MSFSFKFFTNASADTIAGALARSFCGDRSALSKAEGFFRKARGYALGSTAKFFRGKLKDAFVSNPFGWEQNAKNANMNFSVKEMIAGNPPKMNAGRMKKGKKRVFGGRLKNIMLHKIDDKTGDFQVGLVPEKIPAKIKALGSSWDRVMSQFQEAGRLDKNIVDKERMRRYFGALGMPMTSNPGLMRPKRDLMKPMQERYPPFGIFQERYEKKMKELAG